MRFKPLDRGPPVFGPTAEAPAEGISRATFLRGAAALGAAALLGTGSPAGLAASAQRAGRQTSVLDLEFSVVEQFRPFDLLPRPFVQVRERLDRAAARYSETGLHSEGRPASAVQAGPAIRFRSAAAAPTLFRTGSGPAAPFASVMVTAGAPPKGDKPAAILAGLVRDAENYVAACFEPGGDPATGTVAIDLVVGGRRIRAASAQADLALPARLCFAVNENYVTALVGRTADWEPVLQHRITDLLDLRDPRVLRDYAYGFGIAGAEASADVSAVEAGHFGAVGLRDLHVVSMSDGRPYIRDGKLFFTATQAGLSFFQAAHWGVWTLDLQDLSRIEPVAKLFFARDGLLLGDHAGQIVLDERDGGFHLAVSSWGDFAFKGVHIRYLRTFSDILTGVHVLNSERMPLPSDLSSWDPSLVRIGDRWHVGFVESEYQDRERGFRFHPALARGAIGRPLLELGRVGADTARTSTEGVILQKVGESWLLLASDGEDRRYRVYDLEMRPVGFLDAPYGTNIPHPQIVPVPDAAGAAHLLLTFDGTQYREKLLGYGTHGDVIVMRA